MALHLQDILAIFLAALVAFISLQQTTQLSLTHSFTTRATTHPPLIADLDQNGLNDVILVRDSFIEILDTTALSLGMSHDNVEIEGVGISNDDDETGGVSGLPVRYRAALIDPGEIALESSNKVVAVDVDEGTNSIAVLTAGSHIKLYVLSDGVFKCQWQTTAPETMTFDHGAVTIGTRAVYIRGHITEHGQKKKKSTATGKRRRGAEAATATELKVMYYAFDLADGKLMWKHVDSEGQGEGHIHSGEVDWRQYRHSVLSCLPLTQNGKSVHANPMSLRHFSRSKKGGNANGKKNVLVSHFTIGSVTTLQVLHLHTGQMLTQMTMPLPGLYLDIDGNGVLDRIITHSTSTSSNDQQGQAAPIAHAWRGRGSPFGSRHGHISSCWMEVMSGYPHAEQLFNGSLCPSDLLHSFSLLALGNTANVDMIISEPLFIRRSEKSHSHIYFLVSSGVVSSFDSEGRMQWQMSTPCEFRSDFHHGSLSEYSIHVVHDTQRTILCTGGSSVALLDADSGSIVAETTVPSTIISSPVVSDIDNDGHSDILVQVSDGTWHALLLERGTGSAMSMLVGVVAVVGVVLGVILVVEHLSQRTKRD